MAKRTRTAYSLLNIATGIGGYVVNTITGLVCRMIFTKALNAEYLGVNGLFSNILSMLSLAELGIGTAIVYALYKPLAEDDRPKIASLVNYFGKCYRIIGLLVAAMGLALLPFLNLIIRNQPDIQESIRLLYLIYLFNTAATYFFSYRTTLLMAAQQSYIVNGVNYLCTIVQSVIQCVWLLLTHNFLGYLIIQSVSVMVYNVVVSAIVKKRFPCITEKNIPPLDAGERNALSRNVRALVVWRVSGQLVNGTDNIIITFFRGLAAVGMASNYTLLTGTLTSLINLVFSSVTASVGNLNATESKEKQLSLFYSLNLANFWLYGWGAIGICFVSSDLVELLFGAGYVLPASIAFVLALNFYMVGMQSTVWTYKNTLGLFRPGRYLLTLTAAINLVCSIWLGQLWGLFGILFATAISRACTNTWYDPYAVFHHGFGEKVGGYFKRYFTFASLLLITGAVCWLLCGLVHTAILTAVVLKLIICTVIPNAVFFLCFRNREEFAYFAGLCRFLLDKLRHADKKSNR